MTSIEINNVIKRYGKVVAVDDISLTIASGEIIAMVGASGCGKTTLLRCIAGFEEPQAGSIVLDGQAVVSDKVWLPAEKRRVGFVFQGESLFPHLRVLTNVTFGMRGESTETKRQQAIQHLERVGMKGYERRYPHELSGGQRRRVALARVLAQKPRVVLLDEPLSGLDEPLRDSVRDQVHALLRETGSTAIWVTHRTRDALAVADRVVTLSQGTLAQVGAPAVVYQQPVSAEVARLFGPVNVFETHATAGRIDRPFASSTSDATLTGKITACVRPENLYIAADDDQNNTTSARVISCQFEGSRTTAWVATSDGTKLQVDLGAQQIFAPGQSVGIGVHKVPHALHVFETSAGSAKPETTSAQP